MRIATLLPSATEIVCVLGLADDIVAVTHECDYPPEIRGRPVAVRPLVDASAPSRKIDEQVERALRRGEPLYRVDADVLREARPDLLITQDLCDVCALPSLDVEAVAVRLPGPPAILRLHPHTLGDILRDILTVGNAAGRPDVASRVVQALGSRIAAVERAVRDRARPRVFCMEWLDPPFCGGHWMPELVERAGGREVLGRRGRPSFRVEWHEIVRAAPDVVVLAVCGFDVPRTIAELGAVTVRPEWQSLPAVTSGRVYVTDANGFFSRSGPRVVDGLEMLGAILHPDAADWTTPAGAWLRFPLEAAQLRSSTEA
ncbi:MAG TPA: cobalamin-binding protein [bacterium]|nr:cobalamin-binding protein [bacterium]